MAKRLFLKALVLSSTVLFLCSVAFAANPGQYQLVPVVKGDAVSVYLVDSASGDVWEMRKTSGDMNYLMLLPKFEKEKELQKWEKEFENAKKRQGASGSGGGTSTP
jgi:hypothetical protein